MIVQISMVKNELTLIKELLPIWKTYADGFVFLLDDNTDATKEYLLSVKDQFNILEILESSTTKDELWIETDRRQYLFDTARKYTNKIICLDADEYLDGVLTKSELEKILDENPDTVFHLHWIQYTSVNTIRVDGPWKNNLKDRIGSYQSDCKFVPIQMHSSHLPFPTRQLVIPPEQLFIAHLQWLNKTYVAIKQYFWKMTDYINAKDHKVSVAGNSAYDASVNNFEWEEEYTFTPLRISPWLIDEMAVYNNHRLVAIKHNIKLHNIPDLGSWGFNFTSMDETIPSSDNRFKVSVITAIGDVSIYNRYIPRWFANVKEQHFFAQTEHIIVYKEWSEHFELFKQLPNFILIPEEGVGMYNAWNTGIQASTTSYVTNWNIDDLRHPINTKIKYDLLERNTQLDMVYNWYVATANENENFYNMEMSTKSYAQYPDNFHEIVFDNCYAGPDPMWRKSLHDQVGYFDNENFATIGDWEMWIRFTTVGAKFKLIPEVLCIYLDHDKTVSKRQLERIASEKNNLIRKYTV